jgi:hypothetical protein
MVVAGCLPPVKSEPIALMTPPTTPVDPELLGAAPNIDGCIIY